MRWLEAAVAVGRCLQDGGMQGPAVGRVAANQVDAAGGTYRTLGAGVPRALLLALIADDAKPGRPLSNNAVRVGAAASGKRASSMMRCRERWGVGTLGFKSYRIKRLRVLKDKESLDVVVL